MGYDLRKIDVLGQIFGKARRRELEGQVKLNMASIGKRLAVGAVAAGIAAAAKPDLLGTKPGLLSLTGIALTAMIPAGAASAGLVSPARPGSPSATEALVQGVVNVLSAPADKRQAAAAAAEADTQAKITAGVKDGLAKYGPVLVSLATKEITSQFGPGELASEPEAQSPAETPSGGAEARAGGQSAISNESAISAGGTDAAIALVGGNQ